MRFSFPALCALSLSLVSLTGATRAAELHADGRELFLREWEVRSPNELQGDGLGPMFNARSCIACHHLGGIGGAGPNEANVDMLSILLPAERRNAQRAQRLRLFASRVHPAFETSTNIVLHRFSTREEYEAWRAGFFPSGNEGSLKLYETGRRVATERDPETGDIKIGGLKFRITQRNTPALFGAALLEQIDEAALERVAAEQRERTETIRGRVAPRVGRYGWRGQISTLREFVVGACANEVGLETENAKQAMNPYQPDYQNAYSDMYDHEVEALTAFIAQLRPPKQITPEDPDQRRAWEHGEYLFREAKCADCHRPQLAHVVGIYSDLLLHDLGPRLSDPIPAPSRFSASQANYYGSGFLADSSDTRQRLWRTPPLWGVRDSAPYLHDGRAATLAEAIAAHGGEAQISADAFADLEPHEQESLVMYVESLGAPE